MYNTGVRIAFYVIHKLRVESIGMKIFTQRLFFHINIHSDHIIGKAVLACVKISGFIKFFVLFNPLIHLKNHFLAVKHLLFRRNRIKFLYKHPCDKVVFIFEVIIKALALEPAFFAYIGNSYFLQRHSFRKAQNCVGKLPFCPFVSAFTVLYIICQIYSPFTEYISNSKYNKAIFCFRQ